MVDKPFAGSPRGDKFAGGIFTLEMEVKRLQTSTENIKMEVANLDHRREKLTAQIAQNEGIVAELLASIAQLRGESSSSPLARPVTFTIPCEVCESRETCKVTMTCLKMEHRHP